MKKTTITYLLLAAVLTAGVALSSSCTKEEVENAGRPIAFSVKTSGGTPATRGLDPLDNSNFVDFKVWAGYAESAFDSDTPIDGWIAGDSATKQDEGSFATTASYYWPLNGTLTFFACAPAEAAIALEGSQTGSLRAAYTPETFVTNQKDFCIAAPVVNSSRADDPVEFTFEHALTNIVFSASYEDPEGVLTRTGYDLKLDKIEISGVKGSRDFELLPQTSGYFSWTDNAATATDASYSISRASQQISDTKIAASGYTDVTELNGRLYLIPQELTDAAKFRVTFSFVSGSGPGEVTVAQFYQSIALPTSPEWTPASSIRYKFIIYLSGTKELDIQGTSGQWIDDWTTAENPSQNKTIE